MKQHLVYLLCLIFRYCSELPFVWRFRNKINQLAAKTFIESYTKNTSLKCGLKMEVDLKDFGGRYLFIHGFYEPGVTRLFTEILEEEDSVLDIGANIGFFTLLSSKLVGPKGKVLSFEASPLIASKLERNIEINRIENTQVYRNAVAYSAKTLTFYEAKDDHLGISSLRDLAEHTGSSFEVESLSIDSMLSDLQKIKLVKIDIEGAEHLALNGMEELIQRDKPYIILELTNQFLKEFDSSSEQVMKHLQDRAYTLFHVGYDQLYELDDIPVEQCNILASPSRVKI